MRKDIIKMSRKELRRLPIIHKTMEKRLTQVKAAEILDLSDRQIRRIIARIKTGGDPAIVHGNRGKESPFKMPKTLENKIIGIIKEKYHDFGPTFAAEKLFECENIAISREKLRQLMLSRDISHFKRKKEKSTHQWRERKHCRGEMIQMDGSDHDWLEGRGPRLVFMGYIDDASSKIYGRFYESEGTFSAMDSFRRYISIHGIPFSFYVDRHSAYKTSRQPNLDEDLQGEFAKTQFARSLNELDVKIIFARSPQAKGRVERLFGTLQDRLVKELRLANVSTLNQANTFLKSYLHKYNARFGIKPFKKTNLHRPVPKQLNLDEIFCIKEYRSIGNNYSFQWKNRLFIIPKPSITMKKQRICVLESFDGIISAKLNGKTLDILEVTQKDIVAIERVQKTTRRFLKSKKVCYRPPANHPWRRSIRSFAYA